MNIIPNFFTKEPITEITNSALIQAIDTVKKSSSKKEALENAYQQITTRYRGYRFLTYTLFWRIFESDPNKLWNRKKFLHCTQQNFLLRTLLVKSGWFTEDDIELGFSLVWYFSPHQYLKIKNNSTNYTAVDPWTHHFGVPMGYYAGGFGYKSI